MKSQVETGKGFQKNKDEEKWRKELKYTISQIDSQMAAARLGQFMERDKHVGDGNGYLIRSVYFDNCYDKVLREKLDGIAIRDKFRIRYYDFNTSFIRLEKKSKRYDVGHKYQCSITEEETTKILTQDWDWMQSDQRALVRELYLKLRLELFRPYVIVDYEREPFVYRPGNVRITFDRNIRSTKMVREFFNPKVPTIPVFLQSEVVMEIKYDEYLPDIVSRTILTTKTRERAFSKFAACRMVSLQ